jgi:predicted DNA-binding protein
MKKPMGILAIRISEQSRKRLDEVAEQMGTNATTFVREMIEAYMSDEGLSRLAKGSNGAASKVAAKRSVKRITNEKQPGGHWTKTSKRIYLQLRKEPGGAVGWPSLSEAKKMPGW